LVTATAGITEGAALVAMQAVGWLVVGLAVGLAVWLAM